MQRHRKGHINYDVLDAFSSKRVPLVQREGAVKVEYWCAHNDAKNCSFFGGSALRRKREAHTTDACVGTGCVGWGCRKGGESCWCG